MKIVNCFLFVSVLFFQLGCKNSTSSQAPSNGVQDIFPLVTGDHWVYQLTQYSTDGSIKSNGPYDVLLRSTQSFNGIPAFEYSIQGDTSKNSLIYFVGSSDLYTERNSTVIYHALHYPMNVGDAYTITDTTYAGGFINKDFLVLQNNSESITVPAGTFNCLHFDRISIAGTVANPDTNSVKKQYYALNKGLIKESDLAYDINKKQYQIALLQLVSYELK